MFFVASGILMRYSNRNNTLPVTRMTPSSWRVWTFINISALCIINAKPIKNDLVAAPGSTKDLPEDYLARVKLVHESGGYGSKGFNSFPPFCFVSNSDISLNIYLWLELGYLGMAMIGKEKKQRKTSYVLTLQLFLQECCTHSLNRYSTLTNKLSWVISLFSFYCDC